VELKKVNFVLLATPVMVLFTMGKPLKLTSAFFASDETQ
jgi:hypothetical protein